jgi:hypothetical protein
VQVPGQRTFQCRLAFLSRLLLLGLVDGVGAQQIVELVAVGRGLLQEVNSDQRVE